MDNSQQRLEQAYDTWHRERAGFDNDSALPPWYESVYRELQGVRASRILEVGCGRGEFAVLMSKIFPKARISGIDFSEAAIEIAKRRNDRENVFFEQADACCLPFEKGEFDLVISCECLEHVEDPRAMAREVSRVAKPGAKICITTENYFNGMLLARIHSWITKRPFDSGSGVQPRENLFFFWIVRRYLEDAGLSLERTESSYCQWLLLPGVAPSAFCTQYFKGKIIRRLMKPFGRHFSFFLRKPTE
jgi:ubiquinone/menaquinone biosynthesis C-methylase UbiE